MFTAPHSYLSLPERCYHQQSPSPVRSPTLLLWNDTLAKALGITEGIDEPTLAAYFSGNTLPEGATPFAEGYAGHQFGHFVPQLGDGRALMLGELRHEDGSLRDVQLKGSGRTPYSRSGDGRAPLTAVLREYLISEAMAALGIPTTRSLAAVATGETVQRQRMEAGGIITRVARSHIRIGTLEYFAARQDIPALQAVTDYAIARHYPDLAQQKTPYEALLFTVAEAQGRLIARWMLVGFIHGVMNTDNMLLSGETIDYGPCAFMDVYHPATVFSSIDHHGRYAYGNQPFIGCWNMMALSEALAPLTRAPQLADEAAATLQRSFEQAWLTGICAKLGIAESKEAVNLITSLMTIMQRQEADYTASFSALTDIASGAEVSATFSTEPAWQAWIAQWQVMQPDAELMRRHNPQLIPRNYLVEEALLAALQGDMQPYHHLLDALQHPFTSPSDPRYTALPPQESRIYQTFCGT